VRQGSHGGLLCEEAGVAATLLPLLLAPETFVLTSGHGKGSNPRLHNEPQIPHK
jgi:hypothetical protein